MAAQIAAYHQYQQYRYQRYMQQPGSPQAEPTCQRSALFGRAAAGAGAGAAAAAAAGAGAGAGAGVGAEDGGNVAGAVTVHDSLTPKPPSPSP